MVKIKDAENTILMELKNGTVTIELLPDIAPGHCERMKELVRSCLLYTSPSPRDRYGSRMPSSA